MGRLSFVGEGLDRVLFSEGCRPTASVFDTEPVKACASRAFFNSEDREVPIALVGTARLRREGDAPQRLGTSWHAERRAGRAGSMRGKPREQGDFKALFAVERPAFGTMLGWNESCCRPAQSTCMSFPRASGFSSCLGWGLAGANDKRPWAPPQRGVRKRSRWAVARTRVRAVRARKGGARRTLAVRQGHGSPRRAGAEGRAVRRTPGVPEAARRVGREA